MDTDTIKTIITSIVASSLWLGLATFAFKTWFESALKHKYERQLEAYRDELKRQSDNAIEQLKHSYNEKLETHKAQLNAESQIQIERLKAQFQITATQDSVRFSRVFERTADVIAKVYEKLVTWKRLVDAYKMVQRDPRDPSRQEERKNIKEALIDFFQYYEPREIYIDREISARIRILSSALHYDFTNTDFRSAAKELQAKNPASAAYYQNIIDDDKSLYGNVNDLLVALQNEFRKVLGLAINERGKYAEARPTS